MSDLSCHAHSDVESIRLAAVWSHDTTDVAMRTTLSSITAALARFYGTRFAAASLVDAATVHVLGENGTGMGPFPRNGAFSSHVVANPTSTLIVPDAAADPRFCNSPSVTGPLQIRFYAGAALIDGDGNALGALSIFHSDPLGRVAIPSDALTRAAAQASQAIQATHAKWPMAVEETGQLPDLRRSSDRSAARPGATLWLGLRTEASGHLSLGRGPGRLVQGIAASSPASQAGLRVGDVLLQINGHPTRRRHDVDDVLARHQDGDILELRILRGWVTQTYKVRIEPLPDHRVRRTH